MLFSKISPVLFFIFVAISSLSAQEETFYAVSGNEMVQIGDAGNASYPPTSLGGVSYNFQLGAYEQTVQDWSLFLTAAASQVDHNGQTDPHRLWNPGMQPWITRVENNDGSYEYTVVPGKEKMPITHISLYSALRQCNWHEHGCPVLQRGDNMDAVTEQGAYELAEDGSISKNPNAHFYIPSHSEWLKAAYYKGGGLTSDYWLYPTQSDIAPQNHLTSLSNNAANYRSSCDDSLLALTEVDAFGTFDAFHHPIGTYSPYHCFDMAGNVKEWTSTTNASGDYLVCGGSYESLETDLMINAPKQATPPETESDFIGFRMAKVDDSTYRPPASRPSTATHQHSFSWPHFYAAGTIGLAAGAITGLYLIPNGFAMIYCCYRATGLDFLGGIFEIFPETLPIVIAIAVAAAVTIECYKLLS